jgi:hypothetical protein
VVLPLLDEGGHQTRIALQDLQHLHQDCIISTALRQVKKKTKECDSYLTSFATRIKNNMWHP